MDHMIYNRHTWMSDKQWECMQFLGDLFYGFHHMDVERVKKCWDIVDELDQEAPDEQG